MNYKNEECNNEKINSSHSEQNDKKKLQKCAVMYVYTL